MAIIQHPGATIYLVPLTYRASAFAGASGGLLRRWFPRLRRARSGDH
jgi:hypothetical protein